MASLGAGSSCKRCRTAALCAAFCRVPQRLGSSHVGLSPTYAPAQSARDFEVDLLAPANFPVAPLARFRIGQEEAVVCRRCRQQSAPNGRPCSLGISPNSTTPEQLASLRTASPEGRPPAQGAADSVSVHQYPMLCQAQLQGVGSARQRASRARRRRNGEKLLTPDSRAPPSRNYSKAGIVAGSRVWGALLAPPPKRRFGNPCSFLEE